MNNYYNYTPCSQTEINVNNSLVSALKACYIFNEVNGNILVDKSLFSNNGILYNGATYYNNTLVLDGTNDYVEIPDSSSLNLSRNFTIITRFKCTTIQSRTHTIVGKGISDADEDFALTVVNGAIYLNFATYTAALTINFTNNIYYNLAVTVERNLTSNTTFFRYYLNGRFVGITSTTSVAMSNTNYSMSIGRRFYNSTSESFQGNIDYLYIFDVALKNDEVIEILSNPFNLFELPNSYSHFKKINSVLRIPSISSSEVVNSHILPGPIRISPTSINSLENFSSTFLYLNQKLPHYNSVKLDFNAKIPISNYLTLNKPVLNSEIFGSSGVNKYSYYVTACNEYGEGIPSTNLLVINGPEILNPNNFIRLQWNHVEYSTHYKVYGRSENNEKFIANVFNSTHYDDYGAKESDIPLPSKDTSGYHPNKLNLGYQMKLYTDDKIIEKNFISPLIHKPIYTAWLRSFVGGRSKAVKISEYVDLVYNHALDQANNTLYLSVFEFDKKANDIKYKGRCNYYIQLPSTYTFYTDGFDITLDNYSSGYITSAGNSVYSNGLLRQTSPGNPIDGSVNARTIQNIHLGRHIDYPKLVTNLNIALTNNLYFYDYFGYFYAPTTGTYTFYLTSDDGSYLWLRQKGANYFWGNHDVTTTFNTGTQSFSIVLNAGTYTHIRIFYVNVSGSGFFTFEFEGPGISRRSDGTGFFFYETFEVNGTNTEWQDEKISTGSRIGFGSKEPSKITKWYDISYIHSNTRLSVDVPITETIGPNTPYVIQDIRAVVTLNASVSVFSCICIIKGLNPDYFEPETRWIPNAENIDHVRGVYKIIDASTSTMTQIFTGILAPKIDKNTQYLYVANRPGSNTRDLNIYKFNIRATFSDLSGGITISPFLFKTATVNTREENFSRNYREGVFTITKSGRGKDIPSLYFLGYGRNVDRNFNSNYIYRIDEINIRNNEEFIYDVGNFLSYGNEQNSVESFRGFTYEPIFDNFFTQNASGTTQNRGAIIKYSINNQSIKSAFSLAYRYTDNLDWTYQDDTPEFISSSLTNSHYYTDVCNGTLYRTTSSYIFCQPLYAHNEYSEITKNFIVTPIINCYDNIKFDKISIISDQYVGKDDVGTLANSYRVYARTSGMVDDSGSWTQINNFDISNLTVTENIQFKFDFNVLANFGVVSRIHSVNVFYFTSFNENELFDLSWDSTNNILYFTQKNSLSKSDIFEITVKNNINQIVLQQESKSLLNGKFEYYADSSWNLAHFYEFLTNKKYINNTVLHHNDFKYESSSAYFDGNSYLILDNLNKTSLESNNFSLEVTFKSENVPNSGNIRARIFSIGGTNRNSGIELCRETVESTDSLCLYVGNDANNQIFKICNWSDVANNTWNTIVVERLENELIFFKNNIYSNKYTFNSSINNTDDKILVGSGGSNTSPNLNFKGFIEQIKLYNTSRLNKTLITGSPGFYSIQYGGYHGESIGYSILPIASTNTFSILDFAESAITTYEFTSYFTPKFTGNYIFYISSDDGAYMWIGATAESGFTIANAFINNGGLHGMTELSNNINLNANIPVFIRILYGQGSGSGAFRFSWEFLGIKTTNLTDNFVSSLTQDYVYRLNQPPYKITNFNILKDSFNKNLTFCSKFDNTHNYSGLQRRFIFNENVLDNNTSYSMSIREIK